ncbi:unnamed protein product [Caenorhabditis sp. 36 PRJEB53466]|nr:unnamed protein product [Caenorhabditis sp. 36 PRJEB53466]
MFWWKTEKIQQPIKRFADFYPKGTKRDICSFAGFPKPNEKLSAQLGYCGHTAWTFSVEKIAPNGLQISVDCEPVIRELKAFKEWSVEADVSIRLLNHSNKDRSLIKTSFGTKFDAEQSWSVTLDQAVFAKNSGFLNGDGIIFQIVIGITEIVGLYSGNFTDFSVSKESEDEAILLVGNQKFHVSKQILCMHSVFFKTMFHGNFAEKNRSEIPILGVDIDSFHLLLQFIYMAPIHIFEENVFQLLEMGDRFLVKRLMRACENFLDDCDLDEKKVIELAAMYKFERILCKKISRMKSVEQLEAAFPSIETLPPTASSYFMFKLGELKDDLHSCVSTTDDNLSSSSVDSD